MREHTFIHISERGSTSPRQRKDWLDWRVERMAATTTTATFDSIGITGSSLCTTAPRCRSNTLTDYANLHRISPAGRLLISRLGEGQRMGTGEARVVRRDGWLNPGSCRWAVLTQHISTVGVEYGSTDWRPRPISQWSTKKNQGWKMQKKNKLLVRLMYTLFQWKAAPKTNNYSSTKTHHFRLKFQIIISVNQVNVSDVGRNLVPVWWTADEEGALPELGPSPHGAVTELSASRLFTAKYDHVVEICRAALMKNGMKYLPASQQT